MKGKLILKNMKHKELKNIAAKIAKCELIIQAGEDTEAAKRAEEEIMRLSANVGNLDDLMAIDELVMDILEKEKN